MPGCKALSGLPFHAVPPYWRLGFYPQIKFCTTLSLSLSPCPFSVHWSGWLTSRLVTHSGGEKGPRRQPAQTDAATQNSLLLLQFYSSWKNYSTVLTRVEGFLKKQIEHSSSCVKFFLGSPIPKFPFLVLPFNLAQGLCKCWLLP